MGQYEAQKMSPGSPLHVRSSFYFVHTCRLDTETEGSIRDLESPGALDCSVLSDSEGATKGLR